MVAGAIHEKRLLCVNDDKVGQQFMEHIYLSTCELQDHMAENHSILLQAIAGLIKQDAKQR